MWNYQWLLIGITMFHFSTVASDNPINHKNVKQGQTGPIAESANKVCSLVNTQPPTRAAVSKHAEQSLGMPYRRSFIFTDCREGDRETWMMTESGISCLLQAQFWRSSAQLGTNPDLRAHRLTLKHRAIAARLVPRVVSSQIPTSFLPGGPRSGLTCVHCCRQAPGKLSPNHYGLI